MAKDPQTDGASDMTMKDGTPRHVDPADTQKVQDETAARQGETGHKVRYVLAISTSLAAVALAVVLLIWVV